MAPRTRSQSGPAGRRALGTAMHLAPERYWPVSVARGGLGRAGVHDLAAPFAGAGAELQHEVGLPHGRRVVFHHQDGVAEIAQPAQQREQAVGVPRVEPDGRLVEHVERVHQPRAERVGQGDALGLAAGEGARLAVEGEVAEADVVEVAEPCVELLDDQLSPPPGAPARARARRARRGARPTGRALTSAMVSLPRRTASACALRRVPAQSGQVSASWYCRRKTRMYCL